MRIYTRFIFLKDCFKHFFVIYNNIGLRKMTVTLANGLLSLEFPLIIASIGKIDNKRKGAGEP